MMISIKTHRKHDIFRDNERFLNSLTDRVVIEPISLTYFESKVASTKDFDNNYSKLLDYSFEACTSLIEEFFNLNFSAWIFDLGPFLTQTKLQTINNYAPFGNLRKQELADVINIQKCYEFPDGIKYAGIFSVKRDNFFKACVYIQGTLNAVIVLSKRNNILSEDNLDKFFYSSAVKGRNVSFGTLDWAALCLEACPQGDVIVNVGGGFDDLHRSICFYYCPTNTVKEILQVLLHDHHFLTLTKDNA